MASLRQVPVEDAREAVLQDYLTAAQQGKGQQYIATLKESPPGSRAGKALIRRLRKVCKEGDTPALRTLPLAVIAP